MLAARSTTANTIYRLHAESFQKPAGRTRTQATARTRPDNPRTPLADLQRGLPDGGAPALAPPPRNSRKTAENTIDWPTSGLTPPLWPPGTEHAAVELADMNDGAVLREQSLLCIHI